MEPVVVLFDPFHPYVAALVEACHRQWGLRSVCLYTDRGLTLRNAGSQPVVLTDAVAGHYLVDPARPAQTARFLASRFDVRGVMPHEEPYVLLAAALAEELGFGWGDSRTMALFRDKDALKSVVRAAGSPRINASTLVRDADDVLAATRTGAYQRFVLKPNSGMGNHGIGFFEAGCARASIEEYFARVGTTRVVMEQFLAGIEYCVNGQVDDEGAVTVLSVLRTRHISVNGRLQLAASFEQVPYRAPEFRIVADYAAQLLPVTGLVRSPFHMEVMVDEEGPCLIEVAARLAGAGQARLTGTAHGHAVDAFVLAASGYTGLPPSTRQEPDWAAYDARVHRTICGVSAVEERITRVRGVEEVAAMPEFVEWVFQPRLGQMMHRTQDLVTAPWLVTLAAQDLATLDRAEDRVREMIVCNPPESGAGRIAATIATAATRTRKHARALPELLRVRRGRTSGRGQGHRIVR